MSSSALSSPPIEATRRWTTVAAATWPSPTAAYRAETSAYRISCARATNDSCDISRCSGRCCLRIALAMDSLPCSTASSRRSLLNHCRILLRARGLRTNVIQSRLGPAPSAFEVKISMTSPLSRVLSSGTSRPLTRAPMQR